MSKKETLEALKNVKLAMARKYENLARLAKSRAKRQRFLYHAARYHRQAQEVALRARRAAQ
jgi:hypothetical protein